MQTKELGFIGLDYLMMETKWNLTQTSSQVNSIKCLKKENIWQNLEVQESSSFINLSENCVMYKGVFMKVHG